MRHRNPLGAIGGDKWETRDWVKGHSVLQCGHRILPICMQHRAPHTNLCGAICRASGTVTGNLGKETAVHSQRGVLHLLSQVGAQGQSHTGFQKKSGSSNQVRSLSCVLSIGPSRRLQSLGPVSGKAEALWLLVKLRHGRHYRRETWEEEGSSVPCTV